LTDGGAEHGVSGEVVQFEAVSMFDTFVKYALKAQLFSPLNIK